MKTNVEVLIEELLQQDWRDSDLVKCLSVHDWAKLSRRIRGNRVFAPAMKTVLISRIQVLVEDSGVDSEAFWMEMITE